MKRPQPTDQERFYINSESSKLSRYVKELHDYCSYIEKKIDGNPKASTKASINEGNENDLINTIECRIKFNEVQSYPKPILFTPHESKQVLKILKAYELICKMYNIRGLVLS